MERKNVEKIIEFDDTSILDAISEELGKFKDDKEKYEITTVFAMNFLRNFFKLENKLIALSISENGKRRLVVIDAEPDGKSYEWQVNGEVVKSGELVNTYDVYIEQY